MSKTAPQSAAPARNAPELLGGTIDVSVFVQIYIYIYIYGTPPGNLPSHTSVIDKERKVLLGFVGG